uniref:Ig-like domain-containing protein n=1 Tax=Seriola lalandi dorsalis TaxID=1841481 RepID=A0A3B4XBR0_SERLL
CFVSFTCQETPVSITNRQDDAELITSVFKICSFYSRNEHKLKFLGYLNLDNPYPEDDVKGKISFKGDGRKHSNLTISNVSLNDSGVYFCAASYHSATDSPQVNTKTFKSKPNARHTRLSGSSLSEKVHQSPADIYEEPGRKATISCLHSIDNYDQILWYKQSNRQLQLLGNCYVNSGNIEDGVDVKIEGGANKGENCTLTIERLNSSAVYFCAASYHSASYHCSSVQKPLHHTIMFSLYSISQPRTPVIFPEYIINHISTLSQ